MREPFAKPDIRTDVIPAFDLLNYRFGELTGATLDSYTIKVDGEYIDIPSNSLLTRLNSKAISQYQLIPITNKNELKYGRIVVFLFNDVHFELYLRRQGESFFKHFFRETSGEYGKFLAFCKRALEENKLYSPRAVNIKEVKPIDLFNDPELE